MDLWMCWDQCVFLNSQVLSVRPRQYEQLTLFCLSLALFTSTARVEFGKP